MGAPPPHPRERVKADTEDRKDLTSQRKSSVYEIGADPSSLGPHHLASQPVPTVGSGRSITFRARVSAARTVGQNNTFFRSEHFAFGETRRIKSPEKQRRAITSLDRGVASTILNQCEARLARSLLFNQKESPCRSTDCARILPGLPPAS